MPFPFGANTYSTRARDATGPRPSHTGGRLRNETNGTTDRAEWFPLREVRALQRVKLVDIALEMAGVELPVA